MNESVYLPMLYQLLASGKHDDLETLAGSLIAQGVAFKPDVMHALARSLLVRGELPRALELFLRLRTMVPQHAIVLMDLAGCYAAMGDWAKSEEDLQRCLEIEPQMPEAVIALIRTKRELGKYESVRTLGEEVLAYEPCIPEYLNDVAHEIVAAGFLDLAENLFRRALSVVPGNLAALLGLGHVLHEKKDYFAAIEFHEKALAINSNVAEVHNSLANVFFDIGRTAEAADCYRRAIELNPSFAEAYCNLGRVLTRPGHFNEALYYTSHAIRLVPTSALAYQRHGDVLYGLQRHVEAIGAFNRAIVLDSGFIEAQIGLSDALMAQGQHAEGLALLRAIVLKFPASLDVVAKDAFYSNYLPETSDASYLQRLEHFWTGVGSDKTRKEWRNVADPTRRICIGFVSADFREHPVGYVLSGLLAEIDHGAFDIRLYANRIEEMDDRLTEQLRKHASGWDRICSMPDSKVADKIYADGVDVLFDLSGFTGGNRLNVFALKPAPVQVTWLGYFASTGLPQMDYVLADKYVLPESEADHFVEKVCRLPDCYYCYMPPLDAPEIEVLPASRKQSITFGCFNNRSKITSDVIRCWSSVLQSIPDSMLFLKTKELSGEMERDCLREEFSAFGIGPERLRLEGASPRQDYWAAYHSVDLALDPFPFPGGVTSLDGLWMGVPVLTMKGHRFIGHQGEMILRNLGLPDWIASDEDDYVVKAIAFSDDVAVLSVLREGLRERMRQSALCQPERFARNFEVAVRNMWQEWCQSSAVLSGSD